MNLSGAADRNKDLFIAILAHELRTPLATLANVAEILKREAPDAAVSLRNSAMVARQVRTMTRLIDDVLDVTRMRLGDLELRRAVVSVSEIIEQAVESTRPGAVARGQILTVILPSDSILIDADAMRLEQSVQNLLRNAIKYTDSGGQIEIGARRDGNEVVLLVSDTGIGIAPNQLDAIFQLYAQSGQAGTERAAGGLGIGLYLARCIVGAHGGTIRAASAGPGRGSQFTVRLPCFASGS